MSGRVFPPLQWGNLQRKPILLYMLSFHGINSLSQHYKVSLLHAILQYWKKLEQEHGTPQIMFPQMMWRVFWRMDSRHPGNSVPGAVHGAEHAAMRHHSCCPPSCSLSCLWLLLWILWECGIHSPHKAVPTKVPTKWILISVIFAPVSGVVLRASIRF